jgi:hypothetical protein
MAEPRHDRAVIRRRIARRFRHGAAHSLQRHRLLSWHALSEALYYIKAYNYSLLYGRLELFTGMTAL